MNLLHRYWVDVYTAVSYVELDLKDLDIVNIVTISA